MQYDIRPLREAVVDKYGAIDGKEFDSVWTGTQDFANFLARLIKQKLINKSVLNDILLMLYRVKYVNLSTVLIPPDVLQKVPKEFSVDQEILAFGMNGPKLQVAMIDPTNIYAIEYVRKKTGLEVELYLTDLPSFQSVIKGYKSDIQNLFSEVSESGGRGGGSDIKNLAEGVPITKAVNSIIEYAVSEGSSDIHIEPTEEECIVRFRIDGMLQDMLLLLKSIHPLIVARIKIMADLKIDEHRLPQDGRIKMNINELPISLRVSILPTVQGEKIVMRILDESARDLTLKDLGFAGKELEAIEEAMNTPDGMILVTGPTGSGKSTTLYTVLRALNTPEVNINTIEDPVEYTMERVNQTQVNTKIGMTFANGLRSLLRQDPDIIMVGEIRDEETAEMAIHSSMTGHLVLSTLHTNDAPGSIPRFTDMGTEPFLLAATLRLVIAQRLVRRLNDNKEMKDMSELETRIVKLQFEKLGLPYDQFPDLHSFPIPKPVPTSTDDGYKGRIAILEVLEVDEAVKGLIVDHKNTGEIRKEMIKQGHMPMFIYGLYLVKKGVTTLEEVLRVAQE
jgi:type IV pilus assembly protein PilB